MYKVKMVCYDVVGSNYTDYINEEFNTEQEAIAALLSQVIDELECLCGINDDGEYPELRFVPTLSDPQHYCVINAWDGDSYRRVTCYDVVTA